MTDSAGSKIGDTVRYLPFGNCLQSPDLPTDKLFTGQRLDATGLYYYNARYYDPTIGRFISADTFVQSLGNPQSFNQYSYCLNNSLKYIDPHRHRLWQPKAKKTRKARQRKSPF
jgi:RHS repeat-associated protein